MKPTTEQKSLTEDDLLTMIDRLMDEGSQHINVTVGAETKVQTVSSTACGMTGPCAVPNFEFDDDADAESGDDSDSDLL
ncbi:MAG: hypothetical protein MJ065_08190 [Oscillospiraceae bacterium]|nr:hypothetical protein [Oscillospiraceae bacterium]